MDERPRPLELSPDQRAILLEEGVGGRTARNIRMLRYQLRGRLDAGALRESLIRVLRRHPLLSARIAWADGRPVLEPEAQPELLADLLLTEADLVGLEPDTAEERIRVFAARQLRFDTAPRLQAGLFALPGGESCLILLTHAGCFDSASALVLRDELEHGYAIATGAPAHGEAETDAPAYAKRLDQLAEEVQRSGESSREYWQARLSTLPSASTWPPDGVDTAASDTSAAESVFEVSAEVADLLRQFAADHQTTATIVLVAALQTLLARVSPEAGTPTDAVVGVVTSRRAAAWAREMIAGLDNLVMSRLHIDPEESFDTLVARAVREHAADSVHCDLPYPWLLDSLAADLPPGSEQPRCRVVVEVASEPSASRLTLGSAVGTLTTHRAPTMNFDLYLRVDQDGDGYRGRLGFASDLYTPQTAERLTQCLMTLLTAALTQPQEPVGNLPLEPATAVRLAARERPDGDRSGRLAHELVASAAARFPDIPALRWAGGELTYAALWRATDALAGRLDGARRVALHANRSPELVIGLLAILESGAAYVPLDPAYPTQRLDYMLADSGAELLLYGEDVAGTVAVPPGCRALCLQEALSLPEVLHSENPPRHAAEPTDTAYVIYTSGSTGWPKGVVMPHGPLADLLDWQIRDSAAGPGWRTLHFAAFGFDVAFQEIFATLASGGTLVLVDDVLRRDPERLLDHAESEAIGRLFVPFVALRQLAETARRTGRYPTVLREVITAGEQLQITPDIREFFNRTGATLENQYGPSETHAVTAELLEGLPDRWPLLPPVGRPVSSAVVEICDARGHPLPVGVPGEIRVSGPVLADGYVGRDDLTAERFVTSPVRPGQRVYRTGDVGRQLPDGRIEFLGRRDGQVKIRGFRVELGEVEARMLEVPGILGAVVLDRDSPTIGRHLVAGYLSAAADPAIAVVDDGKPAQDVAAHLERVVPDYMIPARFVRLDDFPRTPSGKVDRRAVGRLLDAETEADAGGAHFDESLLNETERAVAAIWRELLGVPVPGPDVGFFRLGGHSLLVARLSTRLEEVFGPVVPLADLFTHETVAAQAALVDRLFAEEVSEATEEELAAVFGEMLE